MPVNGIFVPFIHLELFHHSAYPRMLSSLFKHYQSPWRGCTIFIVSDLGLQLADIRHGQFIYRIDIVKLRFFLHFLPRQKSYFHSGWTTYV